MIPFEFRNELWCQETRVKGRYLRDPTFSRFDTILEYDRHTQTDTRRRRIPRLARRRAVKMQCDVDKIRQLSPETTRYLTLLYIVTISPLHAENSTFLWRGSDKNTAKNLPKHAISSQKNFTPKPLLQCGGVHLSTLHPVT